MEKGFLSWGTTPPKVGCGPPRLGTALPDWVWLCASSLDEVQDPQTGHSLLQMGCNFVQLPSKGMQLTPDGAWLPQVRHNSPQGWVLPLQVWLQLSRMGQGPQEHIEPPPDGLQLSERDRASPIGTALPQKWAFRPPLTLPPVGAVGSWMPSSTTRQCSTTWRARTRAASW